MHNYFNIFRSGLIINRILTLGSAIVLILWLTGLLIFEIDEKNRAFIITGWGVGIPYTIFLYNFFIQFLIPKVQKNKYPRVSYLLMVLMVLILTLIPIFIFTVKMTSADELALNIIIANLPFQLLITTPISWWVYQRKMRGVEEISQLKQELGQSNASFDFLRSQINPHFLFNALNTLYGTALIEQADRTGEGIEKLSTMMRYMLEDNMQEKIPLTREIEYLNNYISLQKLRTDSTQNIQIKVSISEISQNYYIAPMLLIPFVENAFKHGISFRDQSEIYISLKVENGVLSFFVKNNKHEKKEMDPEMNKGGIGLENVRQRLQLQYPESHDLIIKETSNEFIIQLIIRFIK